MSKYGVFIIESLDLENEKQEFTDGYVLKRILNMCNIRNEYYYIRTKKELGKIIDLFKESDLRYLHLSCHANSSSIRLTFDTLSYQQFGKIVGKKLAGRRLFLSACDAANLSIAKEIIPKFKCLSIIGSPVPIDFAKAATFWSGFYYNMHRIDTDRMVQSKIREACETLAHAFDVQINYYSFIRKKGKFQTSELKEYKIAPDQTIANVRQV